MKISNYIIEAHNETGHLLTNLFSGADLFLNNEQYEEYKSIIANLPNSSESELFRCLRDQMIILNDDYSEYAVMKLKRSAAVFNMTPSEVKYVIAPTLACNARCPYCYEKDVSAKKHMSDAKVDDLIEFITKNIIGKKKLTLSWFGGEPLMNSKAIERVSDSIIPLCLKNGVEFHAHMTTNGILTDRYIDLIQKCRIESIQITLDGTKSVYESVKGYVGIENSFEHVVDNIFMLTTKGVYVSIRMNVGRNNIEDLQQLCCLLLNDSRWNDNIDIYFHPLMDYVKNDDEYLSASEYEAMFTTLYQTLYELGYYTSVKQFRIRPRTLSCYGWDMTTFAIGPDGELYNCQHELGQKEYEIGNITSGVHITEALVNEHLTDISKQCEDCVYLPICQGGCFFSMRACNSNAQCQSIRFECGIRMKMLLGFLSKKYGE